mgnify:CR=1 FL=1
MDKKEKLSSMEYWDNILSKAKIPFEVNLKQYSVWLIDSFFREFIRKENYKTLLEVGAGSSAWLPYLAKEYNLTVSGIDYSEPGCKICEENLKILGINYDEVICKDIFQWQGGKKYDIIISLGFIEHFNNPDEVVQIIRKHLNQRGLIITVIPNLLGIGSIITKYFLPEVYKIHKKISIDKLKNVHEKAGLTTLKNNYAGFFYPMIIPWQVKQNGIFFTKESSRKIVFKIIELTNALITKILRTFKIRSGSKFFSPFIIYVGKVKENNSNN